MKTAKWVSYFAIALDCPGSVIQALVRLPVKINTAQRSWYERMDSYFLKIVERIYGRLETLDLFDLTKNGIVVTIERTIAIVQNPSNERRIIAAIGWDKFGNVHIASSVRCDGMTNDTTIQLLAFCWKDQLKAEVGRWPAIK